MLSAPYARATARASILTSICVAALAVAASGAGLLRSGRSQAAPPGAVPVIATDSPGPPAAISRRALIGPAHVASASVLSPASPTLAVVAPIVAAAPVGREAAAAPAAPLGEAAGRALIRPVPSDAAPAGHNEYVSGASARETIVLAAGGGGDAPEGMPGPSANDAQPSGPAPRTMIAPGGTSSPLTAPTMLAPGQSTLPLPRPRSAVAIPSQLAWADPTLREALDLTPESAAKLALENSLDLIATAARVREGQADLIRALGLDDVRLSASASMRRRGPTGGGSDPNSRSAGLSLSKSLFTDKRIELQQDAARRGLDIRNLGEAVVSRALDLSAHVAAYEVLRTGQLVGVADREAEALAGHLDVSRDLEEEGTVAWFEVVQAQTELARAQGQMITARTVFEQALSSLRRLLTLPQETPISVSFGREDTPPPGGLQELILQAIERRPEIHEAQAAVRLAETSLRLAATSRNISVDLTGGLTHASPGSDSVSWQVAISAQKPIIDGSAERSDVMAAKARLETAKVDLQQAKEEVALDVAHTHVAVVDAYERARVAEYGVTNAEERLSVAQLRYENGYSLGVEVLDAQAAMTSAGAEEVNSRYNLQVAIVELRSVVGIWGENGELAP